MLSIHDMVVYRCSNASFARKFEYLLFRLNIVDIVGRSTVGNCIVRFTKRGDSRRHQKALARPAEKARWRIMTVVIGFRVPRYYSRVIWCHDKNQSIPSGIRSNFFIGVKPARDLSNCSEFSAHKVGVQSVISRESG